MKNNYINAKLINIINSILVKYEFENQFFIIIIDNINNNFIIFKNFINFFLIIKYNNIFNIKKYKLKTL